MHMNVQKIYYASLSHTAQQKEILEKNKNLEILLD